MPESFELLHPDFLICELLGHSDTRRWRKCFEFSDTGVWWAPGVADLSTPEPFINVLIEK